MAPSLMDLPSEIRCEIWRLCLSTRCNLFAAPDHGVPSYRLHPAVLRVNRAIYNEALDVFHRSNVFVTVSTPWDNSHDYIRDNGRVPIFSRDPPVSIPIHLEVVLEITELLFFERSRIIVISEADLPAFCRLWMHTELTHDAMNKHLSLTLKLRNPGNPGAALPRAMQIRLLDPFTSIKRLSSVNIEGQVERDVHQSFTAQQNQPYETAEKCLENADRFKAHALFAMKEKQFQSAVSLLEAAFGHLLIIVNGRLRDEWGDAHFDVTITSSSSPYRGQNGNFARILIRIELTEAMIAAYNGLGQFDLARFWGMRSISTARGWLGSRVDQPNFEFARAAEFARIYFQTALACQNLRHEQRECATEAITLYRIALRKLPDDEEVARAAPSFNRLESAYLARCDLSVPSEL